MLLAVIGIGEKGLIRRTLLLKRLDRLRLMLLKLRTRVFQDGYVFLQAVASHVITSTPSQPIPTSHNPLPSHLIQRHLTPVYRHLSQSSSSSRGPPLPVHPSTSTSPSLSRHRLPAQVQTNNQGSWGGKGTKKSRKNSSKKSKFLVQTAGIEPTKRKDFESSNVIISEKKDRKASQFQVKDLPYPYTSVEQYEARFKTPLGSEWNSRSVYQKENMPRVTKKVS